MVSAPFKLVADFKPTGDQPTAIEALCRGLDAGSGYQTLEGVTGSGKTFSIANVIARLGKPTLLVSHNKTLAAQVYAELKSYFPENAVEFFISYYDYYQPEAYIPQTDTYIEKDASINEEIERLRLSATNSLLNREDVIIVASVSCIYGLGSPEDYQEMIVSVRKGETLDRDEMLRKLVDIQYSRNDIENVPGTFRVRGDTIDIFPSYAKTGVRVELFGDEVESIQRIDTLTAKAEASLDSVMISPAKHFVMPYSKIETAISDIRNELEERVAWFESQNKLLEAQRIRMRTEFDIEMLKELGYCQGIENFSRHLSRRKEGERPACLIDYFKGDFLTIIDESHVTVPQIRGMSNGDRARKLTLVEHGFRLPSALDNRPLTFGEFCDITGQIVFTSATPGPFEREVSGETVPQLIRPTGILDPLVEVRPLADQIDDLMEEVRSRAERRERTLVTTLTKRTAEDLSEYLQNAGLRVKYLHSEIDAIERVEILRGLRKADFDCLVGINLLREGLDLPEVSLVAILDADKEGFLRSETSLIQTAGRAARHIHGKVIMYADQVTDSMRRMLDVTRMRRHAQEEYNTKHGITPVQIEKRIQDGLSADREAEEIEKSVVREGGEQYSIHEVIQDLEKEMIEAAEALEFERAAILRDQVYELKTSQEPRGVEKDAGATRYVVRRQKHGKGRK
ncbi:MAG: excinuclease ABC subunit UvrB [Verrucomicrobia bacterium]|nr:excinuclease ABC subunit UvrB [Verrucomicrobiota bacterium]